LRDAKLLARIQGCGNSIIIENSEIQLHYNIIREREGGAALSKS
jgi:hypothetical protein